MGPLDSSSTATETQPIALRKTTVLHVGKFYPPRMGGIETHLQVLCQGLRHSTDLSVIVSSHNGGAVEEDLDGVPVSRLATPLTLLSTPICPSMVRRIRAFDADIVHLHLPNPAAVAAYLASGHRGRLVLSYHSDIIRQRIMGRLLGSLMHAALRRSSAIVVSWPDNVRFSPVLSAHKEKCHVIPYGIPLEQFEKCDFSAVARLRQEYGDRMVLSVGRLVYYKGYEHLIRAMAKVKGRLVIIGEGPLRPKLLDLVDKLGIAGKVSFVGNVPDAVPYYHAASVFALASVARSEAFGIVQIEAMAAGTPVVNTQLDSAVPFVSLHGQTGLTVPPADPEALASALNRLLDDEQMRTSFGRAGKLRARQEFSQETMTARMLELYADVMTTSPPTQRK